MLTRMNFTRLSRIVVLLFGCFCVLLLLLAHSFTPNNNGDCPRCPPCGGTVKKDVSKVRGRLLSDVDHHNDGDDTPADTNVINAAAHPDDETSVLQSCDSVTAIDCVIEQQRTVGCYLDKDNQEIYVPYEAFLRKQFDVQAKLVDDRIEWSQSYARLHADHPVTSYSAHGIFGPFLTYNVENRDRVRCISGQFGVPMSVQWSSTPYYYPIQIAQYALEHYSKNITESQKVTWIDTDLNDWKRPQIPRFEKLTKVDFVFDSDVNSKVIVIDSAAGLDNPGVSLDLDNNARLPVIVFRASFDADASFTVIARQLDTNELYSVHFVEKFDDDEDCIGMTEDHNSFMYALGTEHTGKWRTIVRNVLTDVNRALHYVAKTKRDRTNKITLDNFRLISLSFRGRVSLLPVISQQSSAHGDQFLAAADWFVQMQDEHGGWPIHAKRTLADGKLELQSGWYSAMAQGHAISVLCRAFYRTNQAQFLNAAVSATKLFDKDATNGGIRNHLFDQYPWYEEYPTTPGSFVLNGFIYSLIGLYDLQTTLQSTTASTDARLTTVTKLYDQGLHSLANALLLYDTGHRSFYDLRHLSLVDTAPNLARWDYHALHVYQLYWMAGLQPKYRVFADVARRWTAYAKGQHAKHN